MSARIDFLTGEYPPLRGGVADHTALVAAALVERGAEVHVWTGGTEGSTTEPDGVHVHRIAGVFGRPDLARLRDAMDAAGEPARLVLQWVPHAFGYRGINLPLATWLLARARRRPMDVLVHEPGLAPFDGGVRHFIAAAIQWSMLAAVLMRARRTWVTTPAWTPRVQPFVSHPLQWVGVPSNVPAVATTAQVERVRKRLAPSGQLLVGHFGTHGDRAREHWSVVLATLRALAREGVRARLMLLGRGSDSTIAYLRALGATSDEVDATGPLEARELSAHLFACAVFAQPFPEGVTTRRGSVMAELAHGRPVVTTDGWLTEAVWRERGRGASVTLVPSDDHAVFGKALATLLRDADARTRAGRAARELYHERFALEHTVNAIADGILPARRDVAVSPLSSASRSS
jgi:glycosyltransferase involved in cell wall biosynthesis